MERREKTEFILEQMRLLIALARVKDKERKPSTDKKDVMGGGEGEWVKVRVGGRKVNEGFLAEKENEVRLRSYLPSMVASIHFFPFLGPQAEVLQHDD